MTKFITLTKADGSGKSVFINTQEIQYFFGNKDNTKIVFNGDNSMILVKEGPEDILSLINGEAKEQTAPKGNARVALGGR